MLFETIQKDIITAMKAKNELALSTLRMAKSAILLKEKEKREPLIDAEVEAVLGTLIKQRKDSFDQFTKGGREDLATKEEAEYKLLEGYLPREASGEETICTVVAVLHGLTASGTALSPKLMGQVIKMAKEALASQNLRVDGKYLSTVVKQT